MSRSKEKVTPPPKLDEQSWGDKTRAWLKTKWAKRIFNALVTATATVVCSFALTRFSGTALIFPESWREIVIATGAVTGVVAFEAGNFIREKREHELSEKKARSGEQAHRGNRRLAISVGMQMGLSLVTLIIAIACFFTLRGECVRTFDPTLWLANQAKRDVYLASFHPKSEDDIARSSTQPSEEDLRIAKEMDQAAKKAAEKPTDKAKGSPQSPDPQLARAQLGADSTEPLPSATTTGEASVAEHSTSDHPEFLDVRAQRIYLPLRFPPNHAEYIKGLEIDGQDGVEQILDKQPELMINWLSSDTRMYLARTTLLFLVNYLVIIFSVMYLTGLRFNVVGSLLEKFV